MDKVNHVDKIRLVIVDDHSIFREGMLSVLATEPDIEIVGQGASAEDAVRLARELLPDIIFLDISMPGGGLNAAQSIVDALSSGPRRASLAANTSAYVRVSRFSVWTSSRKRSSSSDRSIAISCGDSPRPARATVRPAGRRNCSVSIPAASNSRSAVFRMPSSTQSIRCS